MSSEKKENRNSNNNFESSKLDQLINALYPLCDDIKWMDDIIDKIKSVHFLETDFEISGLARIIAYEIIQQNPEFLRLSDIKTEPLKELIIKCFNNISVSKRRKENMSVLVEELFNKEANVLKKSKVRRK